MLLRFSYRSALVALISVAWRPSTSGQECVFCPPGTEITNPGGQLEVPGFGTFGCALAESVVLGGTLTPEQCGMISQNQNLIVSTCGCEADETPSPVPPPTAPPVPAPTAPPVPAPTAPPVADPTSPPVADPTSPPVADPTSPPVADPTAPPVGDPTAPPVGDPTSPPVAVPTSPPVPTSEGGGRGPTMANLVRGCDTRLDVVEPRVWAGGSVIMVDRDRLFSCGDDPKYWLFPEGTDYYVKQKDDGEFIIRKGRPGRSVSVWTNRLDVPRGVYKTWLQTDGNLVTRNEDGRRVFRTGAFTTDLVKRDYFMGITSDERYLEIWQGTPTNPIEKVVSLRTLL